MSAAAAAAAAGAVPAYPERLWLNSPNDCQECAGLYVLDRSVGKPNGSPAWRRGGVGEAERWLFKAPDSLWYVDDQRAKAAGFAAEATGFISSREAHGGPEGPEVSTVKWQRDDGEQWVMDDDLVIEIQEPAFPEKLFFASPNAHQDCTGLYLLDRSVGHPNGFPAWRKPGAGEAERWLFKAPNGRWFVDNQSAKAAGFAKASTIQWRRWRKLWRTWVDDDDFSVVAKQAESQKTRAVAQPAEEQGRLDAGVRRQAEDVLALVRAESQEACEAARRAEEESRLDPAALREAEAALAAARAELQETREAARRAEEQSRLDIAALRQAEAALAAAQTESQETHEASRRAEEQSRLDTAALREAEDQRRLDATARREAEDALALVQAESQETVRLAEDALALARAESQEACEAARQAEEQSRLDAAALHQAALAAAQAESQEAREAARRAEERARRAEEQAQQSQASFESSQFKVQYEQAKRFAPTDLLEAVVVIKSFLDQIRISFRNVSEAEVNTVFQRVQHMMVADKTFDRVSELGAYIWTCEDLLGDREICSYVNQAIREDRGPLFDKVVPLVRLINTLLVTRGVVAAKWPTENRTFRGSAMPRQHLAFFTPERWYCVNMFLATSFWKDTALQVAMLKKAPEMPLVLFVVEFDPVRKCAHANYLKVSDVAGEEEFLLPPYSVFQVLEEPRADGEIHVIRIWAHPDNREAHLEHPNLPLAPWH